MAKKFIPTELFRQYEKTSDIEVTKGIWVHPKFTYGMHLRLFGSAEEHIEEEIIIAVAGKMSSRGPIGAVYVGPGNDWNKHIHLIYEGANIQELTFTGAHEALEIALTIRKKAEWFGVLKDPAINSSRGSRLQRVIIKSDLKFLAEAVTAAGIKKLKLNGWKTSYGEEVKDPKATERMTSIVEELRLAGVEAYVWHVSEEENREAHKIADDGPSTSGEPGVPAFSIG